MGPQHLGALQTSKTRWLLRVEVQQKVFLSLDAEQQSQKFLAKRSRVHLARWGLCLHLLSQDVSLHCLQACITAQCWMFVHLEIPK